MWKVFHHWGLPIFGAVCWWGLLTSLIVCWAVQGFPQYSFVAKDKKILFISDVAATNLQPIFISLGAIEAICYVLSLFAERYLRHAGRLLPNWRRSEKVLAGFAIGFGIIGQLGIIMVACFNTHIFSTVHLSMLCVFLFGTGLSCACTVIEFFVLDRSYEGLNRLKISYGLKCLWWVVAFALAVAFGVTSLGGHKNVAAVLEWCLAYSFGFYLLTLAYDLAPAAKTKKGQLLEAKLGNELTRIVSWVPGVGADGGISSLDSHDDPNSKTYAELRGVNNSHLGDDTRQHRQSMSLPHNEHYRQYPAEVV